MGNTSDTRCNIPANYLSYPMKKLTSLIVGCINLIAYFQLPLAATATPPTAAYAWSGSLVTTVMNVLVFTLG